jgi:hypothetical protein
MSSRTTWLAVISTGLAFIYYLRVQREYGTLSVCAEKPRKLLIRTFMKNIISKNISVS